MYDYFNKSLAISKGRTTNPAFIYIRDSVIKNHSNITDWVRCSSLFVPSSHLTAKLISGIGLNDYFTPDDAAWKAMNAIGKLSNSMGLVSSNSFGKSHNNVFLDGCEEVIALVDEEFDMNIPWQEMCPIEFIYHTFTNLNFKLGGDDLSGFGMIKINLPMFAYQYQCWCNYGRPNGNIYNYLLKYPIWNSMKSYIDIAMFNRYVYKLNNMNMPKYDKVIPIQLVDISQQLDRFDSSRLDYLLTTSHTLGGSLYNIPLVFDDSALDLVGRLDMYASRQTDWYELMYNMPFLLFSFTVNSGRKKLLDSSLATKLKYELGEFRNSQGIATLPKQLSLHIIENYFDPLDNIAHELSR